MMQTIEIKGQFSEKEAGEQAVNQFRREHGQLGKVLLTDRTRKGFKFLVAPFESKGGK